MTSPFFSIGTQTEISIDSLSSNGPGVGRKNGIVFFVPNTCPGDSAIIEVTNTKKNFLEAKLVKLLVPSPARKKSECRFSSSCGGCPWIHINYLQQLMQKKKIIADALIRIANLPPPDFEIIKSEKELRYRNRIQVHYHQQSVGYHRKGSNRLVAIDDCLIADERLINLFESLRDKNVRTQKRAELRLVDGQPALFSSEKEAGFLQVNPNQNQNMIEFVHDLIQDLIQQQKVKSFLDLYCGAGNFSLKIAENFPHLPVTGIDNNAAAIQKAKKLAQSQDTGNLRFVREDSLSYISKTTTLDGSLALIDPTRKGCDEQLLKLVSHKDSRALIYVSCNPATWARDIKRLREFDSRWKLTKLTAFDMFPQTPHVEIVSLLSREL